MGRGPTGRAKLNPVPTLPPLGAALRGWSSLSPLSRARGRLSPSLLHILQKKDEVTASERNPLVLQLDTFGETMLGKPVLRGPRLHAL